jgi:hypothetical protein
MKTQTWEVTMVVKLEDGATPRSLVEAIRENLFPEFGEELLEFKSKEVQS